MHTVGEQPCAPMTTRDLIDALGGPAAVAAARGLSVTAVFNWCAGGAVPPRHWIALWRMAKQAGLDWRPPGTEGLDLVLLPAMTGDDAERPAFAQCSRAVQE